jgi:chromosome segregation ATPase
MAASDTFKRPRLASNGVHLPDQPVTINPLELDISHVSDSVAVPSNPHVISPEVIDPSDLNETVRRLQSLLLTAQTSLADHKQDLGELQYRHEDQRNLIVELTRKNEEAVDTAQKAVTRMTENAATANALRIENRSLKEQLKAAQEALTDHSIPERAEFERQRLAFEQSQDENRILEKRLKTQQSDLDYAQEMYQTSSSVAQRLGTTNRELENALSHAQNRANGEQTRAKQMTLDARASTLVRENKQLKAKLKEQADVLARKDKELSLLKEASRGRMGTRGSSVPRSPRMSSPLKTAAGSRQSSPSATELRGRTHPLRQG